MTLDAFSRVRVLVVGDLVADHYVYGQTERVSREAPVLIVRHEREEVKLGGAANAAANARSLGGRVSAVGVLGDDALGAAMKNLFTRQSIVCRTVRSATTETKTRVLAGGASTTRQQMLRIDRGTIGPLPSRVRVALAGLVTRLAKSADVVIASDYGAGVIGDEVRRALQGIARRGIPVCVDSRFSLGLFTGLTVCKPNEPELAALTGLPVATEAELRLATKRALQRLQCQVLLVTRGKRGMALAVRGQPVQFIAAHGQEDAVDVTGAGDTVSAAFGLALGAGLSPAEAAHVANVAGSLVVQKQGTATVSRAELAHELRKP